MIVYKGYPLAFLDMVEVRDGNWCRPTLADKETIQMMMAEFEETQPHPRRRLLDVLENLIMRSG